MNQHRNPAAMSYGWLFASAAAVTFAALSACGGDDDDAAVAAAPGPAPAPAPAAAPTPPAAVPPEAAGLQAGLADSLSRAMPFLGGIEGGLVVMLNPGMPLAPNVAAAADTSAGSPPNTWTFKGKYDGNGAGGEETGVDGRIVFASDPTDFAGGFKGGQGSASLTIDLLGLMQVFTGNVGFALGMNESRVWGIGTVTHPASGQVTSLSVDQAAPLTVKLADGSAGARPNACAHSFNGAVQFSVAAAGGTLASLWRFAYDRTTVTMTGATYTAGNGQQTALPDAEVDLGCGSPGTLADWSGRFRIRWACFPQEFGEFVTTISVKNATTVSMVDDGDTAAEAYDAAMIGTSPRAIRGFFTSGPAGSRYREDFNWVLNAAKDGFTQTSRYVYFEGPQTGTGGVCAARATRL